MDQGTDTTNPEENSSSLTVSSQEEFMNDLYSSVEETTTCELERLRDKEGIVPTCAYGCCYCCQHIIVASSVEAHAVSQYIKRELSADKIQHIRKRTEQWHAWDNTRPGRSPLTETDLSSYDYSCPLLINGTCSVYPVRPIVCRTHYVSSHPLACRAGNNPQSTEDKPSVLSSVVRTSKPFSMTIKDYIENTGLDYSRSIMLLPHWLAINMAWEFDL